MYPGVKDHLVDEGKLRPGMSAVIDGKTTRFERSIKSGKVKQRGVGGEVLPKCAGGQNRGGDRGGGRML